MRLVFIGDVVGSAGCEALARELPNIRHEYKIDFAVVNGENSADGNGISKNSMEDIFGAGVDVITTGNHAFHRSSIVHEYETKYTLLRPANLGEDLPGSGVCEIDCGAYSAAVINLIGITFMQPADNPFKCAEKLLEGIDSKIIIVDFHAEATSEKRAMGLFLAGRTSAVFGTHTHVQTADEQIIDGTGYITDAGMTGPKNSVLGVRPDISIERFRTYRFQKYEVAQGECEVCGVVADIDQTSGKCVKIERIRRIVTV